MTTTTAKRALSREEQSALAVAAQQGDKRARETLIRHNDGFVRQVARAVNRFGRADMEDILQACRIGLNKAIDTFDASRGVHLLSHAVWRMKAEAKLELGRSLSALSLPPAVAVEVFFGRPRPMPATRLAAARRAVTEAAPLDAPMNEDGKPFVSLLADDRPDSAELLDEARNGSHLARTVERALLQLSPREQYILERRRLNEDDDTLNTIGAELGLSRERIRQIELRAMTTLTELLRADPALREVLE